MTPRPDAEPFPEVPVLVYHKIGAPPPGERHPDTYVSPARFAAQMRLIAALGYGAFSIEELRCDPGAPSRPGRSRPLLITFDDASCTVLTHAFPILRAHGFRAAVFMVSSGIGGPAVWDGEGESSPHRLLSVPELALLRRHGWSMGSHSHTHARLKGAADAAVQFGHSKRVLEAALGAEVPWFAYPYGDFDDAAKVAAARSGYRLAFATERGDGSAMALRRRVVSGRSGLLGFLRRFLQARRLGRR